jgi:hypothetical protein
VNYIIIVLLVKGFIAMIIIKQSTENYVFIVAKLKAKE